MPHHFLINVTYQGTYLITSAPLKASREVNGVDLTNDLLYTTTVYIMTVTYLIKDGQYVYLSQTFYFITISFLFSSLLYLLLQRTYIPREGSFPNDIYKSSYKIIQNSSD